MTQLIEISPEHLLPIWPYVLPHINEIASSSRGKLTAGDIGNALMAGGFCMFVVTDENRSIQATVLTEFAYYPRKKICRIVGCVGRDMAAWVHHLDDIHEWARGHGCDAMQNIARKGYAKVLKDYKFTHILLEYDLHEDQAQSAA